MFTLSYDGSFDGFLTVIFEVYALKVLPTAIQRPEYRQDSMFSQTIEIKADLEKADRVWNGLGKKLPLEAKHNYFRVFLSEKPEVEMLLFRYIKLVLETEGAEQNFANPDVLEVIKLGRRVWREQHRMEAFVRFSKMADGTFLSVIAPDFNVLPLISKHFTERYADQPWIIYDSRRQTGLHYNLTEVQEVQPDPELIKSGILKVSDLALDALEIQFQQLWQQYFKSVNIPERKNPKLHLRHIPKRYWRYLSEKQPEAVSKSDFRLK